MILANKYMLEDLLTPIGGTADFDDERSLNLSFVNQNDEAQVKKVISEEIKPYYEQRNSQYQISAKLSLAYFLTTNRVDFAKIFKSCLIIFDHPSEPRLFFVWIWEVLFPGENYSINDTNEFIEKDDLNEANNYL